MERQGAFKVTTLRKAALFFILFSFCSFTLMTLRFLFLIAAYPGFAYTLFACQRANIRALSSRCPSQIFSEIGVEVPIILFKKITSAPLLSLQNARVKSLPSSCVPALLDAHPL